jgi:hypothetical protein
VESLGGPALARALTLLAPGGTCVTLGWSASPQVTLDLRDDLAQRLLDRKFTGKAVLHLGR